ncbi:MAG TPA: hypothetical protein VGH76_16755 [Actinomycetospora sp.]|jgi:hypothetical protein|uniref:hypothetical protein n=1 Tax=Actinomycetospora sp. TaxID=1872135 RepID=UPI002F3ED13C
MTVIVVVAVVLLPLWFYGLALALAAARDRLGSPSKLPIARSVSRSMRRVLIGDERSRS